MTDKERLKLAAKAPDDVRERLLELELGEVKAGLGSDEVARIESLDEEEAERENVEVIRERKAQGKREYNLFLKSLPREAREQIREIERRFHL